MYLISITSLLSIDVKRIKGKCKTVRGFISKLRHSLVLCSMFAKVYTSKGPYLPKMSIYKIFCRTP